MAKYKAVESKSEDELKTLAMDIYNDKVYTNFMIPEHEKHNTKMVFMPLLFMGPTPPFNGDVDTARMRANRIWELLDKDNETEEFEKVFIPSIGMVYEYYSTNGTHNTLPRSLNGLPLFHSCRFLNLEDTDKLRDVYTKYSELRKQVDNF